MRDVFHAVKLDTMAHRVENDLKKLVSIPEPQFSLPGSLIIDAATTLFEGGEPFAKAFCIAARARRCTASLGSAADE